MVNPFENFTKWLSSYIDNPWIIAVITAVIILALTFLLAVIVSNVIRAILRRGKTPIPSMTIYINLARVLVWILGIAIMLSVCFNIDVTALVAGLGIGGIAISLGFKDTIANLISGIQITSCKILEPGDYIEVGQYSGIVDDTSWRHTKIINLKNETVVVPNSVINSTCVIRKKDLNFVCVDFQVSLDNKLVNMEKSEVAGVIKNAIQAFGNLEKDPSLSLTTIADNNVKGVITCTFDAVLDIETVGKVKDAIVKCFTDK